MHTVDRMNFVSLDDVDSLLLYKPTIIPARAWDGMRTNCTFVTWWAFRSCRPAFSAQNWRPLEARVDCG